MDCVLFCFFFSSQNFLEYVTLRKNGLGCTDFARPVLNESDCK
uniref:Uncharacterized protein n=1 Tax=Anguilla anguilla TaxID=7936 RepID=A0A0E9XNV6_ANGAN